jgi:beta-lactamase class C
MTTTRTDPHRLEDILRQEISRFLHDNQTIGFSAALAVGDRRAFHVRGLANRETGWPVTQESLFLIGSVQKVFTATLAAGRILEGKMSFTDQVTAYLPPDVAAQGSAIRQVTIDTLATMTAGMPGANIPDRPAARMYRAEPPPPAAIRWWQEFNPERLIGSRYAYANASEVTLGFASVAAAGRTYPEMFENEIRRPLAMTDTMVGLEGVAAERIAVGYQRDGEPLVYRGVGFNSTAPDMLRFVEANLFRMPVMPPLTVRAMALAHEPRFRISAARSIGMIWYTDEVGDGARIVQKAGGNGGFVAWIGFMPNQAAAVVLLCNGHPIKGGPSIIQTGEQILCRATGIAAPPATSLEHPDGGVQEEDAG